MGITISGSARIIGTVKLSPFEEIDSFFQDTFLLLGFDDQTDGGTTITNEAQYTKWNINPFNTFEAKGDAQVDTDAPISDVGSLVMTNSGSGWVLNTPIPQLVPQANEAFTWEGKAIVDNTVTTELFSSYDASHTCRVFRVLANASGRLQFIVYATNGSSTTQLNLTGTTTSIPNGTAFDWAVERQTDGTVTLFVDGVADATTGSFTGSFGQRNGGLRLNALIGSAPASGQQDYTADEIRCATVARYNGTSYTPPSKFPRGNAYTALSNEVFFTTPGADTWTVPAGVTSATVECWGGGGAGSGSFDGAGGGGGGAYSRSVLAVTPGNMLNLSVGAGGATASASGGDTSFDGGTVLAKGGTGGSGSVGGTGGQASSGVGDVKFSGGSAQTCGGIGANGGGGGGSAASDAANGNTGLRNPTDGLAGGGAGGHQPSFTNFPGGAGGMGGGTDEDGGKGQFPGGGGGGRGGNGGVEWGFNGEADGPGADGAIRISWS